jgi:4-diphosphocytidyl-2-C-methyl-D-erythritol kinase
VKRELLVPAKLTLTLRILGTRPDGFHDLEALTISVDTPYDTIAFESGPPGIALTVSGPAAAGVPADDTNLVVRAVAAVLDRPAKLRIALRKQIPPGAGLGGGSADAAAALRICAEAFALAPEKVEAVAAELGSDVPFCLRGTPAWMRGRGEILDPVEIADPPAVLIAKPPFPLATPAVYRAWDELGGPRSPRRFAPPPQLDHLVDELVNDLEPAAEHVAPDLLAFREAFEAAAGAPALLAGSGSACWTPVADHEAGKEAAARVEAALGVPAYVGLGVATPSGRD